MIMFFFILSVLLYVFFLLSSFFLIIIQTRCQHGHFLSTFHTPHYGQVLQDGAPPQREAVCDGGHGTALPVMSCVTSLSLSDVSDL